MREENKPSERIKATILETSSMTSHIPNANDVRREFDALHDRLVAAESEIKFLEAVLETMRKLNEQLKDKDAQIASLSQSSMQRRIELQAEELKDKDARIAALEKELGEKK
jgi:predicted RNase H-like nuclease (RuvC/YqgF family)